MVFPIAGGNESKGFEVSNSLRFNAGDSAKLTRTQTAGNRKTFTFSGWIKRSRLGDRQSIISSSIDGSNESFLWFDTADELFAKESNEATFALRTNRKFRDPSAWYHIVYAVDTTQGTAGNRVRIYVNGVEETSFADETQPSQNDDTRFNDNTKALTLGFHVNDYPEYFGGYAAEYNFIDGSAKTPTDFGEFDDNGVWIPKKYTGSYGTNGFYLEFQQTGTSANASGIGADTSGNDNHFTPTNLAATDITEDTCTNNFATLNPLDRAVENASGGIVLSEGNCKSVGPNGGNRSRAQSTIGFSSGKWYAEFKIVNGNDHKTQIGMVDEVQSTTNHGGVNAGVEYRPNDDYIYSFTNGSENSNQGSLTGVSNNDIVGVAINADTSPPSIQFYLNGSTQGSAVTYPNTGSIYFFFVRDGSDSGNDEPEVLCNFGNPPYTVSSSNNDGKYGNFEYAPPSGYYALCTKRLAEFG